LRNADYTPDKTAVTSYDDPESYTYAAIHNYANHVVNHLISINVQEGDRVAVLSRTRSVLSGAFFGMPTFGSDTTPLNYRLSQAE
jgi:fatty-acyl-CoA synthase